MMAKLLNLRNSGSTLLLWLVISILPTILKAQNKPLAAIPLKEQVVSAYVDRPGDLYVQLKSGRIIKYDVHGKQAAEYTPKDKVALFDPRDGARAFMYSSKDKWYSFAFFGFINKTHLKEEYAIEPVMACASGDKDIWILDQSDASLKKINTTRQTVDVEVALPDQLRGYDFSDAKMREYQNFLFLHFPASGLYIFSSMGRLIKSFEDTDIGYFNFLGEELYYAKDGVLIFYDLFDGDTREMEVEKSIRFLLITDVRKYTILPNRIEVHTVNY